MNKCSVLRYQECLQRSLGQKSGLHSDLRDLIKSRFNSAKSLYAADIKGHFGCVNAIEFSHGDGKYIASGGDDKRVLLWTKSGALNIPGKYHSMKGEHHSNIFCLAFTDNDATIFSGGNDQQILIHDTNTLLTRDVIQYDDAVYGLSVQPESELVFASACNDGRVHVHDIRSNDDRLLLANSLHPFHSVMFNPVEPVLLATANSKQGMHLWDIPKPTKALIHYDSGAQSKSCMSARFSRDGRRLLSLRRRLPPALYLTHHKLPVCTFDSDGYFNSCTMKSCCFAGVDEEFVVSGSDDFNVYIWKVPELAEVSEKDDAPCVCEAAMALKGHRSICNQVRCSPHSDLLLSSGVEKVIKAWSIWPLPGRLDTETDLLKEKEFVSRQVYTHGEYLNLVLGENIAAMNHDYSERCQEEDQRMLAFFDSLVQRELEGWTSSSDDEDIVRAEVGLYSSDSAEDEAPVPEDPPAAQDPPAENLSARVNSANATGSSQVQTNGQLDSTQPSSANATGTEIEASTSADVASSEMEASVSADVAGNEMEANITAVEMEASVSADVAGNEMEANITAVEMEASISSADSGSTRNRSEAINVNRDSDRAAIDTNVPWHRRARMAAELELPRLELSAVEQESRAVLLNLEESDGSDSSDDEPGLPSSVGAGRRRTGSSWSDVINNLNRHHEQRARSESESSRETSVPRDVPNAERCSSSDPVQPSHGSIHELRRSRESGESSRGARQAIHLWGGDTDSDGISLEEPSVLPPPPSLPSEAVRNRLDQSYNILSDSDDSDSHFSDSMARMLLRGVPDATVRLRPPSASIRSANGQRPDMTELVNRRKERERREAALKRLIRLRKQQVQEQGIMVPTVLTPRERRNERKRKRTDFFRRLVYRPSSPTAPPRIGLQPVPRAHSSSSDSSSSSSSSDESSMSSLRSDSNDEQLLPAAQQTREEANANAARDEANASAARDPAYAQENGDASDDGCTNSGPIDGNWVKKRQKLYSGTDSSMDITLKSNRLCTSSDESVDRKQCNSPEHSACGSVSSNSISAGVVQEPSCSQETKCNDKSGNATQDKDSCMNGLHTQSTTNNTLAKSNDNGS